MNAPLIDATSLPPLAGSDLLESISRALSAGPERAEVLLFLYGAVGLIALILLLARIFGSESGAEVEPQTDYLTLAVDLLGLSESDRRDLQRIARAAKLTQPAALLLSPMNLARAVALTPETAHDQELRRRLEQLCLRLFDAPLPDPGHSPPVR